MESLQRTESLIGIGNAGVLLVLAVYFYRKSVESDKKLFEQEQRLSVLTKQQDTYQSKTDKQVKELKTKLRDYETIILSLQNSCDQLIKFAQYQSRL